MIEDLVEYSITIIDTDWGDYDRYENHIRFFQNFQKNLETDPPSIIDINKKPFGEYLSLDLQEFILKMKHELDNKYWIRFQYFLKHTNPVIDYLEKKKSRCYGGGRW